MARLSYFETGKFYHVYNRGTDKRDVFMDDDDFGRGIRTLFECNDANPVMHLRRRHQKDKNSQLVEVSPRPVGRGRRTPRSLLVDILAFVLMKNHFHLLLRPLVEGGLSKFMQKFGTGYSNFFNLKYARSGSLFQGAFKAVPVVTQAHFVHLPFYIHANPLDYFDPGWRSGRLASSRKALDFLKNYRWSSFPDYIGETNFPSVTQREFLLTMAGGEDAYRNEFVGWIKAMDEATFSTFKPVFLE